MDEEIWLEMLRERNNTAHVYNANAANELINKVIDHYIPEFNRLKSGLNKRHGVMLTAPDKTPTRLD